MSTTSNHINNEHILQDHNTMRSIKVLVGALIGLTAGLIVAAFIIIY